MSRKCGGAAKMNMKSQSQSGFSLIELMTVVGIIGALAVIGIPQFGKFQAKARQVEAKTSLAALFTAEKGFFSEYTVYTIDVKNAGFSIEGARIRYDVGFPSGAVGVCYAVGGAGLPVEVAANAVASANLPAGAGWAFALPTAIAAPANYCTVTGYKGSAFGNPNNSALAPNNQDQWQINEEKILTNSVNGLN